MDDVSCFLCLDALCAQWMVVPCAAPKCAMCLCRGCVERLQREGKRVPCPIHPDGFTAAYDEAARRDRPIPAAVPAPAQDPFHPFQVSLVRQSITGQRYDTVPIAYDAVEGDEWAILDNATHGIRYPYRLVDDTANLHLLSAYLTGGSLSDSSSQITNVSPFYVRSTSDHARVICDYVSS